MERGPADHMETLWIAKLTTDDGRVTARIILRDETLVPQAQCGGWSVDEYRLVGPAIDPSENSQQNE